MRSTPARKGFGGSASVKATHDRAGEAIQPSRRARFLRLVLAGSDDDRATWSRTGWCLLTEVGVECSSVRYFTLILA
jgi:hypothetical protein